MPLITNMRVGETIEIDNNVRLKLVNRGKGNVATFEIEANYYVDLARIDVEGNTRCIASAANDTAA